MNENAGSRSFVHDLPQGPQGIFSLGKSKAGDGLGYGKVACPVLFAAIVALICWLYPAVLLAAPTISYVQSNYATPQTAETTVTVPFTAIQAAGDLNVVVVGWNDTTAAVRSVTDKRGNTYTRAVGPTVVRGAMSQSIYFAKNIASAAAGANAVTVTFSTAAAYPDIRILEYSGADLSNPVDVTAARSGSSATSTSGSATTTNATDLIFGANIVTTTTSGPGSGFAQRLLSSPDSDIAEDRMVTAKGSYSATAPLSSGAWIMQMIAFRTPVGDLLPPTTPSKLTATAVSTSQINLSWTASKSSVGLANYLVERCQGTGCTNFAQIATPAGITYNDTGLASNTNYSYRVRATDAAGNMSPYSNVASAATQPVVTSTINYVQGNYATPQAAETTVTVPFTAAQAAGDLNVVVVGWNDSTSAVSKVADKSGNAYTLAVGPTVIDGSLSQSIYYARSIAPAAAGANAVTVTFSTAAAYPDIRILEYSGADPNNPVDVTAASSGSSATSSSGSATTTSPTDLIFGANIVTSLTSGPGSNFAQRLMTSPDGDIAEDHMMTATGNYAATAPLSSGSWIMQMVAFRTASGLLPPPSPTSIAVSPASVNFGSVAVGGASSQSVTLSNTGTGLATVSLAVATGSGFKISGLPLSLTLSAGQSTSFSATFAPTTAGSASGNISIISTASDSPLSVSLLGTGVVQALSATPSSLGFGNVTVGSSSDLPVVVTDTGSASVTISQTTTSGAGFSVTGPALPLTLAAGQNTSFSVTFHPASTGSVTGGISVISNASDSPTGASLSATGVNQHSVTLTWGASTSSNITGYNVYRGTVAGGSYTKLNSSPKTGTAYTDTTVDAGQTYYYVTTAVDSQGIESGDSNQATATIPSP
ncbi:MAG: choice-of-anchor D domain-containing protein [Terriglobia bacterium]